MASCAMCGGVLQEVRLEANFAHPRGEPLACCSVSCAEAWAETQAALERSLGALANNRVLSWTLRRSGA